MKAVVLIIFSLLLLCACLWANDTARMPQETQATDSLTSPDTTTATAAQASESKTGGEYPMSPERRAKLISYSRLNNIWRFVSFFVGIAVLAIILFARWSARFRDWASNIKVWFFALWAYAIMLFLTQYLLELPFTIYRGYFVERQYGFMNQGFLAWWGEDLLTLFLTLVFMIVPIAFFYWLVKVSRRWWLWFSVGIMPVLVIAVVVIPVYVAPLFNKYEPLQNKQLKAEILALADKAGINHAHVFEVDASKQSSKVNAYVTGLLGSKRIVLYDTLIKDFTPNEIRFVMGHEMGHYVKHHIWWGLGVTFLFILFALWLTSRTIGPTIRRFSSRFGFDRLSDMASLPLVLIYLNVIVFFFQPITNAYSRHQEKVCDLYGLRISGVSTRTAVTTFEKLSAYNLSDPDPNPIIVFWFYDHPSLEQRIAYVRSAAR